MKQIQFTQTGDPASVVRCGQATTPVISRPGDVLVRIDLFPINPADLLTLQGYYPRSRPDFVTLGIEATGLVENVGPGVVDIEPGDRVVVLGLDNWSEYVVADQSDLALAPPSLAPERAACIKVNPATAARLLREFASLRAGDWVVQNSANSAVGRAVRRLAVHRGLNLLNAVRRPDLLATFEPNETVVLDDNSLPEQVAATTGISSPKLLLDGVAGDSTMRLVAAAGDAATVVTYGAASGAAGSFDPTSLVFRDVRLRGFWLTRWLTQSNPAERRDLYTELGQLAEPLDLTSKVVATFDAADIAKAVEHAVEIGANGKVLVRF